jgi:hypothetical protein
VLALVLAFFLLAGLTRAAKLGCCQQADMGCWQLANAPYASYLPCRVNVRAWADFSNHAIRMLRKEVSGKWRSPSRPSLPPQSSCLRILLSSALLSCARMRTAKSGVSSV